MLSAVLNLALFNLTFEREEVLFLLKGVGGMLGSWGSGSGRRGCGAGRKQGNGPENVGGGHGVVAPGTGRTHPLAARPVKARCCPSC